jgi:hypothetical protein
MTARECADKILAQLDELESEGACDARYYEHQDFYDTHVDALRAVVELAVIYAKSPDEDGATGSDVEHYEYLEVIAEKLGICGHRADEVAH